MSTAKNIEHIIHLLDTKPASANPEEHPILHYTAGLRAILELMPENTDTYPNETISNLLWVIELLLKGIHDNLDAYETAQRS